ncbi:hypothetical protein LCGC14_2038890 [marine sediment metagenome]|uniref:Uncharacterized protein n=1 Tax=marine sediment metagenome TaxID=412755 RepID=A0A0F9ESB5_9ZZZZ
MSHDYLDELLAVSQVLDLGANPADYRRTVQTKAGITGVLVPLVNGEALEETFAAAETYLHQPKGWPTMRLLSGKMRQILDRARARKPTEMKYLSFEPAEYTVYHAQDPAVRVFSLHTRPEPSWFLPVLDYALAFGETLGRMKVECSVPVEGGGVVYPVTIRTKWRALTDQRVIKALKETWTTQRS